MIDNERKQYSDTPPPQLARSPIRSMAMVASSVLLIELLLMFIFKWAPPIQEDVENLLDAVLLTILVSPVLYFYFFRPQNRAIRALIHADELIREQRDHLEEEVQARTAKITEKNDALAASEQRFRGLVEQTLAGIYIVQDHKIAYANLHMAGIFGYARPKELLGRNLLSLITEQDRQAAQQFLDIILDASRPSGRSHDFTAVRKDGSQVFISAHGSLATYNAAPAIIGLMQDVTESKLNEAKIQRYVKKLEGSYTSVIEIATKLVELRDPYTDGHEKRVGQIAMAIGNELGLDQDRIEGLKIGGYIHDIGKISIPSEILTKPGKLLDVEYDLVKSHAQNGHDILKGIDFPWPIAEIAYQHHERMDGSGYPRGLVGDEILFEARIIAVADVVEAMASHRPYRSGIGLELALKEIERGRGLQYDAGVVDACLHLFRDKGYELPAQSPLRQERSA